MQLAKSQTKEKIELGVVLCLLIMWAGLTFAPAMVEIFSTAAIVLWLFTCFKFKQTPNFFYPGILWTLGAYFSLCLLSLFFSDYPEQSLRGMVKVLQSLAIFTVVADTYREEKYRRWFEGVTVCVFSILVVNGVCQYITGVDFIRGFHAPYSGAGYRIQASFKSYGLLASYLISVLPLIAVLGYKAWSIDTKKIRAILIWGISLAGFCMLILTRSRGALAAFIVGLGIFLLIRRKITLLLSLIVLVMAIIWYLPRQSLVHRDIEGKEQSIVERYHLWDRAVQVIQARPWLGSGINTYAVAHEKYDQKKNWRVRGYYAHNGYLQMAAETGLPSLIVFLLFIIFYFKISFFRDKDSEPRESYSVRSALLLGSINFLLFMGGDTVFHNDQAVSVFWYVLGIQCGYLLPKNQADQT